MKIALVGKMCSGKTHVSNILSRRCALKKFAFADKVKEIAKDLFNMKHKNRELLQKIGQSMRVIDKYVWINYLLYKINNEDRVIIDDVRYPNELIALRDRGFIIIKLIVDKDTQRERLIQTYPNTFQEHFDRLNHESEIHIDNMEGDFTIKSDENVIENILECIDPYYGKSLDSSSTLSASMFS
jgi:dephospho-CoA kinase